MNKNPPEMNCLFLVIAVVAAFYLACFASGCALPFSVTPADRAAAYKREARAVYAVCKAYDFDRAAGLVGDVPEMTQACGGGK